MKKSLFLFILLSLPCWVSAGQIWPKPQGYVNDLAQVIPADQSQSLESFLTQVEQQTGAQIAVVTIPSVDGGDVDGAAVDLFKAWGIGKKGKDNGVLILASVQDRRVRIEVGYGLEAVITDGTAGDIIREYMTPYFKQGDYGQGLTNGAAVAAQLVAQSEGVTLTDKISVVRKSDHGNVWVNIFIFILFLVFMLLTRGRGLFFGGYYGGWGGGGGFGSGGGGGGFGGFGGGGSGGGGASGGW